MLWLSWVLKISAKKVVFLVSSERNKKCNHFWSPRKNYGKILSCLPLESFLRCQCLRSVCWYGKILKIQNNHITWDVRPLNYCVIGCVVSQTTLRSLLYVISCIHQPVAQELDTIRVLYARKFCRSTSGIRVTTKLWLKVQWSTFALKNIKFAMTAVSTMTSCSIAVLVEKR